MPSADEFLLAGIAVAYLAVVGFAAWWISRRADALLRQVHDDIDPQRWSALGAPASMRVAMGDPQRRWAKFVGSGGYRRVCSRRVAAAIDDHRRLSKALLICLAAAGAVIVYSFWDLLEPVLLP